jgi:hypothetical protein
MKRGGFREGTPQLAGEDAMSERARVALAALTGAGVGAVVGYLYLTDRGRQLREDLEPRLDDVIAEMRRLRSAFQKARLAAEEAWRALSALVGEPGAEARAAEPLRPMREVRP